MNSSELWDNFKQMSMCEIVDPEEKKGEGRIWKYLKN